jgi:hypothetical protein
VRPAGFNGQKGQKSANFVGFKADNRGSVQDSLETAQKAKV